MALLEKPVPTIRPAGAPWNFVQAAKYLNISLRTLIRLADANRVRSIRYGRRRLIPAAELERLASEGCE
jgi:excisionase family DNA binding protein